MMKRIRWLVFGAGAGVALYVWATRKAREKVPEAGTDALKSVQRTAGELGARMREALREGRSAFQDRRKELTDDLLPRR